MCIYFCSMQFNFALPGWRHTCNLKISGVGQQVYLSKYAISLTNTNGSKISDKISIKIMLNKFGLLSMNQLAAKIKLIETWKSINKEGYPIVLESYSAKAASHQHDLRLQPNRIFKDRCKLKKSESSFHIDAARLWNAAPAAIKSTLTLYSAKKEIDKFCKTLPV